MAYETSSFEEWYLDYHPRLVTVLVGISGRADDAIEAADEALARALERWPRVSQMKSPEGWTYAVALNLVRRRARRATQQSLAEERFAGAQRQDEASDPNDELWRLVGALPIRQRTAVVLRVVGGLTEPEIATAMGVSRGTVSSTLGTAFRRLRAGAELLAEEHA